MTTIENMFSRTVAAGIAAYLVMFGVKFTAYAGPIFIG